MKLIIGNLLYQQGTLLQVVNDRKLMGAGLAKQIADRWPNVKDIYLRSNTRLGQCDLIVVEPKVRVANLYAQRGINSGLVPHHRRLNYGYLAQALRELSVANGADSQVYVPYQMGCGLAMGNWSIVFEILTVYFPDAIIVQRPEDKP